jgi:hypothetical protein
MNFRAPKNAANFTTSDYTCTQGALSSIEVGLLDLTESKSMVCPERVNTSGTGDSYSGGTD